MHISNNLDTLAVMFLVLKMLLLRQRVGIGASGCALHVYTTPIASF